MSEEEKNFLENIKNILSDLDDTEDGAIISLNQEEIDSLKSIPELIEKQQNKIASLEKEIKLMKSININDNFISKEKIRKTIYSNNEDLEIILKIKKLLEENNNE